MAEEGKRKQARRHHYLPQFYLAGFTPSGNKDDKLWVFDLETGEKRQSGLQNVACERDFYRLKNYSEGEDFLEKFFAELEGKSAEVFRRIEKRKEIPERSSKDYEVLINFIACLTFRNPKTRKWSGETTKDMWKRILLVSLNSKKGPEAERLKNFVRDENKYELKVNPATGILDSLQMTKELVPLLAKRRWSLIASVNSEDHFITSDYPVTLDWIKDQDSSSLFPPGFGFPQTAVTMPLNKYMALIGVFEDLNLEVPGTTEAIAIINHTVIRHTFRFLYSPSDDFIWLRRDDTIAHVDESIEWIKTRRGQPSGRPASY